MLNSVSKTALLTLKARAAETEKDSPLIKDPRSLELLHRIRSLELTPSQRAMLDRKLPASLTSYIALRARKYDSYAAEFLNEFPSGLIVSLGAGFDTRYWRIPAKPDQYVEVDLPDVIGAKRNILGGDPEYEMIGCSVLEQEWMDRIALKQKENLLLLAEGLLMYLPEMEVVRLLKKLASGFPGSRIVIEVVHQKYTRGMRNRMVEAKMRRRGGTEEGDSYQYGISEGKELESYASNLQLIGEWSYFEEPDLRPAALRLLRHFKAFSRTQWTVRAKINEHPGTRMLRP